MRNRSVADLPGVGYMLSHRLEAMNVKTCADLQSVSLSELQKEFGQKNGLHLYQSSRGLDETAWPELRSIK